MLGAILLEEPLAPLLDAECLGIISEGYQATMLDASALRDGHEEVLLERGYALEVVCLTPDGIPLEGCLVTTSRRQLCWIPPETLSSPGYLPGFGLTGIHRSVTGSTGKARIYGLHMGSYDVGVNCRGYALVEMEPHESGGMEIPQLSSVRMTLAPLLAAVYVVDDDTVLGARYHYPLRIHNTLPLADMEREARQLGTAFPAARVVVLPVVGGGNQDGRSPLAVTAFLQETGLVRFEVPMRPVAAISAPTAVRVSQLEHGEVSYPTPVRIEQPDGADIPIKDFLLLVDAGDGTGESIEIPIATGLHWLPGGRHPIASTNPWLEGAFYPTEAEIPGEVSIRLKNAVRPCRIEVLDPDGNKHDSFVFSIRHAGKCYNYVAYEDSDQIRWLPTGESILVVSVWGYMDSKLEIDIPLGVHDYSIRVLLEEKER
jgi:hypothetical protein